MFNIHSFRVHVGAPRPSKRTKVTSYLKRAFCVAHTRALSVFAQRGSLAMSPAFGSVSVRPKFLLCLRHTKQARAGHREKPRRRRHTTFFQAELNSRTYENRACAYARAPSTSVRPSPVSSNPPVCHFASRRVSCVAAKATVEVGFASPFSSPRAAVARRTPAVSLDGATNVGVVIFDSVVLVIVVCRSTDLMQAHF